MAYLILKIYAVINHQHLDIHLIKKQAEIISSFSILFFENTASFNMVVYSKTCLTLPQKKRPKMAFKTDYRLMQVKSIAECSFSKLPFG